MVQGSRSRPNLLPVLFGYIVAIGLTAFATYSLMQPKAKNVPGIPAVTTAPSSPVAEAVSRPTATDTKSPEPAVAGEFRTAKYGGLFSFEYPTGYHVAELWPTTSGGSSYIVMDPEPINTSPRGGPLGKFTIALQNGKTNPDEIFQKELANFNDENYTDITKETISADIGQVYHYQGKMKGPMMEGEPVESYYFTFHKNASDPVNQQVVSASLVSNRDPAIAAMFRHIILSFRELNK